MNCNHGAWTSANSIFRFMTPCELCEEKMWGLWNAAQCSDCGKYMHDSCATILKKIIEDFKTLQIKTDRVNGTNVAREVGYKRPKKVYRKYKQKKEFETVKTESGWKARINGDGKNLVRDSPLVWKPKRVGPPLLIPIYGGPIWITPPFAEQFNFSDKQNNYRIPKQVHNSPPIWNPVRVGPPLLIPIRGGPILIT